MKRRFWLGLGSVLVVGTVSVFIYRGVQARRDAADLEEQLRLARAEGLPVTMAEYVALIPKAIPSENAALLYKTLGKKFKALAESKSSDPDFLLSTRPFSTDLAKVQAYLSGRKDILDVVDEATRLPHCWFDRDWSLPFATMMPEFGPMKQAAKLVLLRGTLEEQSGHVTMAIDNAHEAMKMAAHIGEEPGVIPQLVREAVYSMSLRALAVWAMRNPGRPEYLRALKEGVSGMHIPDMRRENADHLAGLLALVDLSTTPEGRKRLGEEDVGALNKLASLLLSQAKGRVQIVQAERERWAAMSLPPNQREPRLEEANLKLSKGLFAFPLAFKLYENLGSGDDTPQHDQLSEARRLQYTALFRALSQTPVPKSIKTSDLMSPFDGEPLRYKFDGRQIVITVSSDAGEGTSPLKIPPDPPLGSR